MRKINIHPVFALFCLILLIDGKGVELGATVFAVTIHECGHYYYAKRKGFRLKNLSLMPYGAVMYAENGLPDKVGWEIALAGPAVNLFFALTLGALWWFFPALYPVTKHLFFADLCIGAFNLLPCYPLDGSRIILCLTDKKMLCLRLMRGLGILFGAASLVLFIVGLFYYPTLDPLFLSVMFFMGATTEVKKEMFRVALSDNYFMNDLTAPIEEKTICVLSSLPLKKLIDGLDGRFLYRVKVIQEGKEIALLEGKAIENVFYADGSATVEEYLSQNKRVGV